MKKIGLGVLVLFLGMAAACPSYGETAKTPQLRRTVSGNVKSVDYVGSQIVLMNVSNFGGSSEMLISVTENTRITRDGDTIVLPDIEIDDVVDVTFRETAPGIYEAVTINDESVANE